VCFTIGAFLFDYIFAIVVFIIKVWRMVGYGGVGVGRNGF